MSFSFATITPYQLALFCQQAYADVSLNNLGEWESISTSPLNDYAYHGVAYVNRHKKLLVIAHRGTNPTLLSNILSDASLTFNKLPPAQDVAKNFSEAVRKSVPKDYEVIETGHSLGAFHAEMNVAIIGSGNAVTLESPGIVEMCETLKITINPEHFTAIFAAPNAVNTAKGHPGTLYRLYNYHVDEEGYRLDEGGFLQNMAEALLTRSIAKASSSFALPFVKSQQLSHDLAGLIKAMHPQIGYPYLMREMRSWPPMRQFVKAYASLKNLYNVSGSAATCTVNTPTIDMNRAFEKALGKMEGYKEGDFVFPTTINSEGKFFLRIYAFMAKQRYDVFYDATKETLSAIEANILNIPVEDPDEATLGKPRKATSNPPRSDANEETLPVVTAREWTLPRYSKEGSALIVLLLGFAYSQLNNSKNSAESTSESNSSPFVFLAYVSFVGMVIAAYQSYPAIKKGAKILGEILVDVKETVGEAKGLIKELKTAAKEGKLRPEIQAKVGLANVDSGGRNTGNNTNTLNYNPQEASAQAKALKARLKKKKPAEGTTAATDNNLEDGATTTNAAADNITDQTTLESPKKSRSKGRFFGDCGSTPNTRAERSLVDERLVFDDKKWVVSIVKSPGKIEHAFLLIEGMQDGLPVYFRTDYFLDLDARKEIVAKLPQGIANVVNTLWASSDGFINRGFVKHQSISREHFEALLHECNHKSFSPTTDQVEKLMEEIIKETKKENHVYLKTGNNAASSVSNSVCQPHNCVSWCETMLEVAGISEKKDWSFIKRPSTVVHAYIDADKDNENGSVERLSSFQFFQQHVLRSDCVVYRDIAENASTVAQEVAQISQGPISDSADTASNEVGKRISASEHLRRLGR